MAAVQEREPILTSYDVTSSCYGPQRKEFWTSLCPLSFVVIALILYRRIPSPPPTTVPKDCDLIQDVENRNFLMLYGQYGMT